MPAVLEKIKEDKLDLLNDLIKEEVKVKQCTQCKEIKSFNKFGNRKRFKDGKQIQCLDCNNLYYKKYYKKNKDTLTLKQANYRLKEKEKNKPVVSNKECTKCLITKPSNAFYLQPNNICGLSGMCKDCNRINNKIWQQENKNNRKDLIIINNFEKKCNQCQTVKSSYEFIVKRSTKDGLSHACKQCINIYRNNYHKTYYKENTTEMKIRCSLRDIFYKHNIYQKFLSICENKCCYCKRIFAEQVNSKYTKGHNIDHFIPLSKGGENKIENFMLLCKPCNSSKRDKLPEEFFGEHYERINNERLRIISELNISNEIKELIENVGK